MGFGTLWVWKVLMRKYFGPKITILTLFCSFFGAGMAKAQMRSELRYFSDSYISPAFEATNRSSYQFFGANLKTVEHSEDEVKMDVSGAVAFGAPLLNYLNISEFYYNHRQGDNETFVLGRKRVLWSELDARFDLGVWEPVFKWNPLAAERQGLTGLFWHTSKQSFAMTLFASPLYIPDQGPSFEIDNGEFVRGNPWFRRPPESIRLFSQTQQIEYNFLRPSDSEIVFHTSYGARMILGDADGLRAQFGHIYKPANQLALGYAGAFDIPKNKAIVDIQPEVFYHSLTSLDLSYKTGQVKWGLSGLYDRPNQDPLFEEKWTRPVFSNATLISPYVDIAFQGWALSLSRLDVYGGKVREEGALASEDRPPLSNRYPFRQANQAALISDWKLRRGQRVTSKVSYLQSELNEFSLLRLQGRYRWTKDWGFHVEAQLVQAQELNKENQNDIAQFSNNDRFMIGVSYAL